MGVSVRVRVRGRGRVRVGVRVTVRVRGLLGRLLDGALCGLEECEHALLQLGRRRHVELRVAPGRMRRLAGWAYGAAGWASL